MNILQYIRKPLIQTVSAIVLAVLGGILILTSANKTIYLLIDGKLNEYKTYSITVSSFLQKQGINLTDKDRLDPGSKTILWGNETVILNRSNEIQIQVDGELLTIITAERNPTNILLEAGFLLFPYDRLMVDGSQYYGTDPISPGSEHMIEVLRGTPIELQIEGIIVHFISDADTLGEALRKEGVQLYEADQLSPPPDTILDGSELSVELIRSKPLLVQISDKQITIRTTAETVGPALAQGGLALQGRDYSIPSEIEPLPESGPVEIVRVKEEILLEQEQVQFITEYQPADDLELDKSQILSGGEFGIQAKRLRVLYENEVEVDRKVEKEWVLKEAKPRVIGYGTQINLKTAITDDGKITYWRKITAWATSYNPTCPGCTTYTSSGADLKKGVIAVTLDWYRYMKGAKVYIPGYGFASIEDVGGGVPWSTNWVDLGYKEKDYVPWSQNVIVYFLAPAPPPENIMYVLY